MLSKKALDNFFSTSVLRGMYRPNEVSRWIRDTDCAAPFLDCNQECSGCILNIGTSLEDKEQATKDVILYLTKQVMEAYDND